MNKYLAILAMMWFVWISFWYIGNDVWYASLLSQSHIIVKQENPDKYRLDDKIIRQEVIGMALKMANIPLPDNYKCKWYFSDVPTNDWVCRSVEIAADNGIITRKNKITRPKDFITPEEATAMFMNVKKITYPKNVKVSWDIESYKNMTQWMIDLHEWVAPLGITIPYDSTRKNIFQTAYQTHIYSPGLRFEACHENSEKKPYIHILGKRIDLTEIFPSEEWCLWLWYGSLRYKTWDILSVKLCWEIACNKIVSINVQSGIVETDGVEWVSQDGTWWVLMTEVRNNSQESSEVVLWIINIWDATRDGHLLIYDSYSLPISLAYSNTVELSPDRNIVAIYAEGFGESKIYIFNRKLNKITKTITLGENELWALSSVDNNGKYTLKERQ